MTHAATVGIHEYLVSGIIAKSFDSVILRPMPSKSWFPLRGQWDSNFSDNFHFICPFTLSLNWYVLLSCGRASIDTGAFTVVHANKSSVQIQQVNKKLLALFVPKNRNCIGIAEDLEQIISLYTLQAVSVFSTAAILGWPLCLSPVLVNSFLTPSGALCNCYPPSSQRDSCHTAPCPQSQSGGVAHHTWSL